MLISEVPRIWAQPKAKPDMNMLSDLYIVSLVLPILDNSFISEFCSYFLPFWEHIRSRFVYFLLPERRFFYHRIPQNYVIRRNFYLGNKYFEIFQMDTLKRSKAGNINAILNKIFTDELSNY